MARIDKRADELLQRDLGARPVALVDDEDVGDLEQTRLHRLDVVAEPRRGDDDAHVSHLGDVDLALPGADRLEQDEVEARRVERVDDADGCRRQSAEVAAARQRAHEDAVVVERRRHADAVAEDRPARDGARRIDGDDADRASLGAHGRDDAVDERRLAGARRTGEPDDERVPEMGCMALSRAGATGDSRSSSVMTPAMARRSPRRMRAMRSLISAWVAAWRAGRWLLASDMSG